LAGTLSNELMKPVTDATGLKSKYDFTLSFHAQELLTPEPSAQESDLPTIFAAVQQQLGLKLEAKKGSVDFLVIDHVEKTPTEN
jgi:uncharacterized protein (TIGR03435 family)